MKSGNAAPGSGIEGDKWSQTMDEKQRKGAKSKRKLAPRDPSWRFRRALGQKVEENPKAYRRRAERRVARKIDPEPEHD